MQNAAHCGHDGDPAREIRAHRQLCKHICTGQAAHHPANQSLIFGVPQTAHIPLPQQPTAIKTPIVRLLCPEQLARAHPVDQALGHFARHALTLQLQRDVQQPRIFFGAELKDLWQLIVKRLEFLQQVVMKFDPAAVRRHQKINDLDEPIGAFGGVTVMKNIVGQSQPRCRRNRLGAKRDDVINRRRWTCSVRETQENAPKLVKTKTLQNTSAKGS